MPGLTDRSIRRVRETDPMTRDVNKNPEQISPTTGLTTASGLRAGTCRTGTPLTSMPGSASLSANTKPIIRWDMVIDRSDAGPGVAMEAKGEKGRRRERFR